MLAASPRASRRHSCGQPVDAATALKFDPGGVWRRAVLMRLAQRMGRNFDTDLSASGEVDTGEHSFLYVHYPEFAQLYDKDKGGRARWSQFQVRVRRLQPWRLVYGLSFARLLRQTILVNSEWMGLSLPKFHRARGLSGERAFHADLRKK